MSLNDLSHQVIGCAMEIHTKLGPGLLENVYHRCMEYELTKRNIPFGTEVCMSVKYETLLIENGYKADLIINNQIIVELKSIEKVTDVHKAQLLTYLRMSGLSLGLLMNFKEPMLKNGLYRIANGIKENISALSADTPRTLREA